MPPRTRPTHNEAGRRIAAARHAEGLSQAALAAALALDRTAISKIESGTRRVGSVELAQIARTLNRPIEWFLSGGASKEGSLPLLRRKRAAILRLARKHGARSVRVFGSVARGDATPDSDIDLLVDMGPGSGLFQQAALLLDLQELLGRDVDVVTPEGLRERIRDRVLREAIAL